MKSNVDMAVEVKEQLSRGKKIFVWADKKSQLHIKPLGPKDWAKLGKDFPGYIGLYDWMASLVEIERDITNFYVKRKQAKKCTSKNIGAV